MRASNRLFEFALNGCFLVSRIIVVNLLWLICSIPLITIPPALLALYVTVQTFPNQDEHLFALFFRIGKNLFWRSYVFVMPVIVILVGAYAELTFYTSRPNQNTITVMMTGMVVGFLLIFSLYLVYFLPIASRTNVSLCHYPMLLLTHFRGRMFVTVSTVILVWVSGITAILFVPGMLLLGIIPLLLLATHYLTNTDFESRFKPFINTNHAQGMNLQ